MPAEGLEWLPAAEVLDDAEIIRLVGIGVRLLGITTVRLTGGEPLLRKNLEALVAELAKLDPRPSLALTTNGIGLAKRAGALAAAGLNRINISLDTLDPETFARLARRPRLPDVLAGVAAARQAGLEPVKINTVLMRGINDHEAYRPAALGDGGEGPAAVHRTDAVGRSACLAAQRDGHRRRDTRAAEPPRTTWWKTRIRPCLAVAHQPNCSGSPALTTRSASSLRCRSRSAGRVIGCD